MRPAGAAAGRAAPWPPAPPPGAPNAASPAPPPGRAGPRLAGPPAGRAARRAASGPPRPPGPTPPSRPGVRSGRRGRGPGRARPPPSGARRAWPVPRTGRASAKRSKAARSRRLATRMSWSSSMSSPSRVPGLACQQDGQVACGPRRSARSPRVERGDTSVVPDRAGRAPGCPAPSGPPRTWRGWPAAGRRTAAARGPPARGPRPRPAPPPPPPAAGGPAGRLAPR